MSIMRGELRISVSIRLLLGLALASLGVALACAGALALPGVAAASPSLDELQKEAKSVRVQMEQLNEQMKVIAQKHEAAEQRLNAVNARLSQTRLDLARAQGDLDRQRGVVADRWVSMYKSGNLTWLDIVASSSSLSEAQTAVEFLRKIAEEDQRSENEYQRLAKEVKALEKSLEDEHEDAVAAQAEIDAQGVAMEQKLAERAAILKDLVARIKKILSAPELLMKAGGKVTQVTWAQAFVKALGMPMTADNVAAIVAWEMAEGGHWYNTAYYNPLNTTQSMPGATVFNSVGVKAYVSWAQGLKATVITIRNGYYGGILDALRSGNDAQAVAGAVASSPWGTGSFNVAALAGRN
jgi:peptidoglycan hydrolase CwlO-like protein